MSQSIDTSALLAEMRAMARQAGVPASRPDAEPAPVAFTEVLQHSLDAVNGRSAEATTLRTQFEAGNPDVELSDVMIAMQKARVSFEALTQVRNKMVSAYRDVMNMPL